MTESNVWTILEKLVDGVDNNLAIMVIGVVMVCSIFVVPPETEWLGNLLSGGVGGIIGYLTGQTANK